MLPQSWSELTWRQLCECWQAKLHYGGKPDVARVVAWLSLSGFSVCRGSATTISKTTGETCYTLQDQDGTRWTVTAREAAQLAQQFLPWFDYPYGDPGEKEVTDEQGKIIKPRREPVSGYVSAWRDAMVLPEERLTIQQGKVMIDAEQKSWRNIFRWSRHFKLPEVACNNLTWQQYRALQTISPQLFDENTSEDMVLDLQAQFLAHCLTPRSFALLDTAGGSIRLRPHYEYRYNAEQADELTKFWKRKMKNEERKMKNEELRMKNKESHFSLLASHASRSTLHAPLRSLFHICFQCYQTALTYYSLAYPLLFSGDNHQNTMRDALQGEVGTINTVMKYAGYAEQQQVYDSNLPFVLDILNTMAKEAKEIEKMNAKMKKK